MGKREIDDMSDAEKALLTDEERAALESDDEGGDEPQDELEDKAEAPAAKEEEDEAPTEVKEEGEPAAVDEPDEDEPRGGDLLLLPETQLSTINEEREAINKRLADLTRQFEDGEITTREFASGQQEAFTKLAELTKAEAKAEFARDFNNAQWERDVRRFLRDNEQYRSPILYQALNAALAVVNKEEGAESLDGDQLLREAHKRVMKEFGQQPPPAAKGARPMPKNAEAEARARRAAPKTLAEVPAADDADVAGGKFSHLDRLSGMDYERALAKLSPEEAAAYEAEE